MERDTAADLLTRLHEAQGAFYAGGDSGPVLALLTDDIAWHVPGRNAIAGDYLGPDEVVGYFIRRRELAQRSFRMHPGELLVGSGQHVAALTDGTAVIDGRERCWSTVGLYQVRDGLIAECWLLPLDPVAFDEIWSNPSGGHRR
jgi:ketosteroid isomerase-like protein